MVVPNIISLFTELLWTSICIKAVPKPAFEDLLCDVMVMGTEQVSRTWAFNPPWMWSNLVSMFTA
jgi:hypothetical protein